MVLKRKEKKQLEQNAVRNCSQECYFFHGGRPGCEYYKRKQVKHGETCLLDLERMKSLTDAFVSGELDSVKAEASEITAQMIAIVRRMIEQVQIEGVTLREPVVNNKGDAVWVPDPNWDPHGGQEQRMVVFMRTVENPLIQRINQVAKNIGLGLDQFKLTPKSADEKRQVSGNILVDNQQDLAQVIEDRKMVDDRFIQAVKDGGNMLQQDETFLKLLNDGDIVA